MTPAARCVRGVRGRLDGRASLTTMPQAFRDRGWLTMSTGKVFHTDEGGAGNACPGPTCWMNGPAMPPLQDPRSWTRGLSMADVNAVAAMARCNAASPPGTAGACAVNASLSGNLAPAAEAVGEAQLCDRTDGLRALD